MVEWPSAGSSISSPTIAVSVIGVSTVVVCSGVGETIIVLGAGVGSEVGVSETVASSCTTGDSSVCGCAASSRSCSASCCAAVGSFDRGGLVHAAKKRNNASVSNITVFFMCFWVL